MKSKAREYTVTFEAHMENAGATFCGMPIHEGFNKFYLYRPVHILENLENIVTPPGLTIENLSVHEILEEESSPDHR